MTLAALSSKSASGSTRDHAKVGMAGGVNAFKTSSLASSLIGASTKNSHDITNTISTGLGFGKVWVPVEDESGYAPGSAAPDRFVLKTDLRLFGAHETALYKLCDRRYPQYLHYRAALPKELSMGLFLPSMAGTALDAIAMRDTTLECRSSGPAAELHLTTTMAFSGALLQPVNTLLRDVFGQEDPRIRVSGSLGMLAPSTWLTQPLAFSLRGELPEMAADLFGVLTVTHLGVDVSGLRRGSAGGYDLAYTLFGRGRLDAATHVEWRIFKFGKQWKIAIRVASGSWRNVAGINGVDVGYGSFAEGRGRRTWLISFAAHGGVSRGLLDGHGRLVRAAPPAGDLFHQGAGVADARGEIRQR
jgi:hypothetical protein